MASSARLSASEALSAYASCSTTSCASCQRCKIKDRINFYWYETNLLRVLLRLLAERHLSVLEPARGDELPLLGVEGALLGSCDALLGVGVAGPLGAELFELQGET